MEEFMPNKYDKPLFVALKELMAAQMYDSVNKVIDVALSDSPPLEKVEEIKKEKEV